MADFSAVLTKTIEGLGSRNTAEMRQKVYEKARKTIADKLAAITPPPSAAMAERQYKLLDDAISQVESRYAAPAPKPVAATPMPVSVPPAAAAPVTPPRPDRDPLEDFLASVQDEARPAPAAAPAFKPAADTFRKPEPLPPVAPKAAVSSSPDPVLGLDGQEPPLSIPGMDAGAQRKKGGGVGGLIYALLGVAVIGGAGYAGYVNKDKLQQLFGMAATPPAKTTPAAAKPAAAKPAAEAAKPAAAAPAGEAAKPAGTAEPQKFTQRLTPEGQEIDAGPGAKPTDVGEGQTVAAATTPATGQPAAADPAAPATPGAEQPAAIPVGQRAIFYEEKTGTEAGTADQGAIVWSKVMDSPGVDQPEEPAIRGEITVPGKNIKMRITIKRNGDKSLPASHIIEMLFTTPADAQGGPIEAVQRMAMKDTEQAPGSPLVGVPAAFGDGFFLIALTDEKTAIETNTTLLQRQNWIDIPIAYRSGRRALVSFEKGLSGDKVFKEVFAAWDAKPASGAASGG